MSEASADALTRHYESLQSKWHVVDRSADYSRLVVPTGNNVEPIHRWFHLKEAYSNQLLRRVVKDAGLQTEDGFAVFDPFAGSGTTLVSAIALSEEFGIDAHAVGVERNPFLYLLGKTKASARLKGSKLVKPLATQLVAVSKAYRELQAVRVEIPPSATLANEKYFSPGNIGSLLRLRMAIDNASAGIIRDIFRVCLGSAVEPASMLRRDGRALRFEANRKPRDPWDSFTSAVEIVAEDLKGITSVRGSASVKYGDGRVPHKYLKEDAKFDLIVFSPPYPNNIDYTEVYKTEAWVLGCYENSLDMRKQRLSTVRSHPSVRFDETYLYRGLPLERKFDRIVDPIIASIPDDARYRVGRQQIVRGYADDMLQVLINCRRLAADGSQLVFIVGNSVHGSESDSFIIAADVMMGALSELAGWRVEEVRVARHLRRRGATSHLLRESAVALRPV
ncbi:DNA methylase [Lentzea xinjiangensis]|uniref:DNA methylase n=1 Tax=Lentzea xinjiangensis TaxID=402600 RepID=A0A1H9AV16_9PSEU|nr:hypothetical protein [Lentzea xinjiangensis]SEP80469.1 DNA methylase [Lentzea xinjiangensis]